MQNEIRAWNFFTLSTNSRVPLKNNWTWSNWKTCIKYIIYHIVSHTLCDTYMIYYVVCVIQCSISYLYLLKNIVEISEKQQWSLVWMKISLLFIWADINEICQLQQCQMRLFLFFHDVSLSNPGIRSLMFLTPQYGPAYNNYQLDRYIRGREVGD